MSIAVLNGRFSRIHMWAPVAEVESKALDQLKNIAELPWVKRIAVMPDVHLGHGATVGSVIGMKDALAPGPFPDELFWSDIRRMKVLVQRLLPAPGARGYA